MLYCVLKTYNSLRDDVSAELGTSSKGAMSFYPPVAIPVDVIRSQTQALIFLKLKHHKR